MFIGMGFPIPNLSNLPGPSRPGHFIPTDAASYEFKFKVAENTAGGVVTILAQANSTGYFTIKWQDGTTQTSTGSTSITSPAGAGTISINKSTDTTWCDEFKIVSGQDNITEVVSWGQNTWNKLIVAFDSCTNLTSIGETSLITDSNGDLQALFRDCTGLTEAIINKWNLSAGIKLGDMFEGCTNLTKLDLTDVNMRISSSTARAFKYVGSTTTDGCEFLMSGLNLSTWSYTGTQNMEWFRYTKIKPTSTFANWSFNPSNGPNGMVTLFESATITGTNSTLDISGWSSYSGNSMAQWFQNFNKWDVVGNTGAKINITNFNTTNVNNLYFFGWRSGVTEFTGLSTLGANTGNTGAIQMERSFSDMRFLKLSGSSNFGNAFTSSIKPSTFKSTFRGLGAGLTSDYSEAPIFSNMDASSCGTFQNMLQSTNLATMPDFDTVTFPTTAVSFASAFSGITATSYSGSHLDFSNATFKPSTFSSLLNSSTIEKVTFGNNVDLSECTIFTSLALNGGSNAQPMEIILPTLADYSSAISFNTAFQGLDGPSTGNPPLTTCVADTLIRRLFATNLNGALTLNLETTKTTGSPSVVSSHITDLTTAGWTITDNTTDAVMPFVYATPLIAGTPNTPTGSFTGGDFSSSDAAHIPVDVTTGVINTTNIGNTTIKYTLADGCYNEQAISLISDQIDNVYSMAFDGANNLIDTGESILHTTSSTVFSVSAWINVNNVSGDMNNSLGAIIADAPAGDPTSGGFWLGYDDRGGSNSPIEGIAYNIKTSGGFQRGKSNNNVISSNTWTHVTLVLDGQATLYINGVDSTNRTIDQSGTLVTQSNELTIGGFDNFSFDYKGLIDEVAIFNTALTESEALNIYNATSVVDGVVKTKDLSLLTTPPIAWYRMGD